MVRTSERKGDSACRINMVREEATEGVLPNGPIITSRQMHDKQTGGRYSLRTEQLVTSALLTETAGITKCIFRWNSYNSPAPLSAATAPPTACRFGNHRHSSSLHPTRQLLPQSMDSFAGRLRKVQTACRGVMLEIRP